MAVEVSSQGERLLLLADVLTHPVQLERPEWLGPVETWPAHSVVSRRRLLTRAARERLLVAAYHLPFPGLGRLAADGSTWTW